MEHHERNVYPISVKHASSGSAYHYQCYRGQELQRLRRGYRGTCCRGVVVGVGDVLWLSAGDDVHEAQSGLGLTHRYS